MTKCCNRLENVRKFLNLATLDRHGPSVLPIFCTCFALSQLKHCFRRYDAHREYQEGIHDSEQK